MADGRDPLDLVRELRSQGQRGFVLGDNHDQLSLPTYLRDNMGGLKAAGVGTIFVEFPDSITPLIDRLPDPKAASDLRDELSARMAPHHSLAGQANFEMILAANAAGIRVIPIDSPGDLGAFTQERLEKADAAFADAVRKNDDGGGYIVAIGAGHTYAANLGLSCIDNKTGDFYGADKTQCKPDDKFLSPQGGVDARLGVPSIDMSTLSGPTGVFNASAKSNYLMQLPEHPQQKIDEANVLPRARGETRHYASEFEKLAMREGRTPEQRAELLQVSKDYGRVLDAMQPGGKSRPLMDAYMNLEDSLQKVAGDQTLPDKTRQSANELADGLLMQRMDVQMAMAGGATNIAKLDSVLDAAPPAVAQVTRRPSIAAPRP